LAIAGAVNAAIAAAYYLRIVSVMYFQPAAEPVAAAGGPTARWSAIVCAGLVVVVGAWPGRLLDLAIRSEAAARPQLRTVQATSKDSIPVVKTDHDGKTERSGL
jgi:NADH:ubiquinone oxidoreductase subunit 2 (subunit N)